MGMSMEAPDGGGRAGRSVGRRAAAGVRGGDDPFDFNAVLPDRLADLLAAPRLRRMGGKLLGEGERIVVETRTHWKEVLWPGILFVLLCGAFITPYMPTMLSESTGFFLGAMALGFLWSGLEEKSPKTFAFGIFCLSLGLYARALEKAGFVLEGQARAYLKINDAWADHLLFGVIRDEFVPGPIVSSSYLRDSL